MRIKNKIVIRFSACTLGSADGPWKSVGADAPPRTRSGGRDIPSGSYRSASRRMVSFPKIQSGGIRAV